MVRLSPVSSNDSTTTVDVEPILKADDECSQLGGPKLTACIIYRKLTLSRASRWFIREWEGTLSRACALATAARSSPSRCQLLHCRLAASPEPLHDCTRVYVNSGYRRADRENIGTGAQSMERGIVATCAETTCVQRKGNKQVGSEPGHWEGTKKMTQW